MSSHIAPSAASPLVTIRNLQVSFSETRVLHGVDLDVGRGEALGLVGESGSGKSVTWLAALGLLGSAARVTGDVWLEKQSLLTAPDLVMDRVRGGRIGLILQDPSSALNPVIPVGRQIGEVLALHAGLKGEANRFETRRLMDQVGIPDAKRRYHAFPHELSGGQNQRVMIAMALAGGPDLLVADEPTTALDVTIQAQILDLIAEIRRSTGMALVLISHDLGVIAETCQRVAVMYAGRIVEQGQTEHVFEAPGHPYTAALLASLPPLGGPRQRLQAIPGTVPDPRDLPRGCAFGPRCGFALPDCADHLPSMKPHSADGLAACLRAGQMPFWSRSVAA
jgi:peptide/nickel transport system ATP-binding protein